MIKLKSPIVVLLAFVLSYGFVNAANVQTKGLNLTKGKKVILRRQVRAGVERLYTFEAQPGQRLSVLLLSADKRAVFSVNNQGRNEYESFETDKREWTGRLPESDNGIYSIAVTTSWSAARYTLEITL